MAAIVSVSDGWNRLQEHFQTERAAKPGKMTAHGHLAEIATRLCFRQSVFTRPRPIADLTWHETDRCLNIGAL